MLEAFIQFFALSICFIYSSIKLLHLNCTKKQCLQMLPFLLLTTLLICYGLKYTIGVRFFFPMLLSFLMLKIFFHISVKTSLLTSLFAFAATYTMFAFAIIINSAATYPAHVYLALEAGLITTSINSVLHIVLTYALFRIRRFRNGMPFLYDFDFLNFGIICCLSILICYFALSYFSENIQLTLTVMAIILILSFVFCIWWLRRIRITYLNRLHQSELSALQEKLQKLQQDYEKLYAEHEMLAHLVHKDNKLIPAMEFAVCEFLEQGTGLSPEERLQKGNELSLRLKSLSQDRSGILSKHKKTGSSLPKSGINPIDIMLSYMNEKAKQYSISFHAAIEESFAVDNPDLEEELSHLLSDLIDNAIIATKDAARREISVVLEGTASNLAVTVMDSGMLFTPDSYQHFGVQKNTTHAEEGGTGTGLMDIWKIKSKYRATLLIREQEPSDSVYSVQIMLLFNRKNHFFLETFRAKELRSTLRRPDLMITAAKVK